MPAIAQPIETAPRDGTHIVGLCQWGWLEMWFKSDPYDGEFWMDQADSEPVPTHWIELPMVLFENKYIPNEPQPVERGDEPST